MSFEARITNRKTSKIKIHFKVTHPVTVSVYYSHDVSTWWTFVQYLPFTLLYLKLRVKS